MFLRFLTIFVFFFSILFVPLPSHATNPQVPQLINVQMILTDEGGNKLPIDVQQKEMTFQIVDGGGNVDFEEQQTVPVVKSAISVMVGYATDGGIPYEAFAPGESKMVRMKVNDQSIPQEDLLIASVPYSMYAGYATNLTDPLDAAEVILNGSIDIEHLSEALLAYIDNAMVGISAQDLENHKTEQAAHPASSINVENNFTNLNGDNVQSLFESVDNSLNIKEQQDEVIDEVIQAVEAEIQAELETLLKLDGSRSMAGDLNMGASNIIMAEGATVDTVDISALQAMVVDITNNYVQTEDTANWDKDASDDVTDDETTNWDKDVSDDFNTSTVFSGDVSGTYDNLQLGSSVVGSSEITDGAVATSDMASSNISQWNNDSNYITDGNTNWNNEYNFITDGNTNWDNDYGFITKAEGDSYYSSTSHNHDGPYVNYTGDTMTGALTMSSANINMNSANIVMNDPSGCTPGSSCNTVDGEDVSELGRVIPDTSGDSDNDSDGDVDLDDHFVKKSGDTMTGDLTVTYAGTDASTWSVGQVLDNHEERLDTLEILDPSQTTAFAYGSITGTIGSTSTETISCSAGYHITNYTVDRTGTAQCQFSTDAGTTNYQVIFSGGYLCDSSTTVDTCYVTTKNTDGFEFRCTCGIPGAGLSWHVNVDFVIYKP